MSSASKNILLFGAFGVIGQHLIEALIQSKWNFDRIGIFTSPGTVEQKAAAIESLRLKGVDVLVGEISNDGHVREAYQGFDTIISALGRNVIEKQIDLIRIAEATPNIKSFFPSEYGTDIEYWPKSAEEKVHQQKLKVRAYCREHVKRMGCTYLVTGPYPELFVGSFQERDAGTFDAQTKKAVLLGTGEGEISFTTMPE
jgi:hypothetical protein